MNRLQLTRPQRVLWPLLLGIGLIFAMTALISGRQSTEAQFPLNNQAPAPIVEPEATPAATTRTPEEAVTTTAVDTQRPVAVSSYRQPGSIGGLWETRENSGATLEPPWQASSGGSFAFGSGMANSLLANPPMPGNADFVVSLYTDNIWGRVGAGETVTVTIDGAQRGAAQADNTGFFWTTLYDTTGAHVNLVGGEDVAIYHDGALAAETTLRSITGGANIVSDTVTGNISGISTPISVTVYAGWREPAATAFSQTVSSDASGNFTVDFSGLRDFCADEQPTVAYVEDGIEVHSAVYGQRLVVQPAHLNGVLGWTTPGMPITFTLYESDTTTVIDQFTSMTDGETGRYEFSAGNGHYFTIFNGNVAVVNVAGGIVMTRAVGTLSTPNVDTLSNLITGQGEPGAVAVGRASTVTPLGYREVQTWTTISASGAYTLDFNGIAELEPNRWYGVYVADAEGDDLNQWAPARGGVVVNQTSNIVEGFAVGAPGPIPIGKPVTLTVYSAAADMIYEFTEEQGFFGQFRFEGEHLPDIAPGDIITVQQPGFGWKAVAEIVALTAEPDVVNNRFVGEVDDTGARIEVHAEQWNGFSDQTLFPIGEFADTVTTASSPFTATTPGFDVRNAVDYAVGHRLANKNAHVVSGQVDFVRVWPQNNGLVFSMAPANTPYTITLLDGGGGFKAQLTGISGEPTGFCGFRDFNSEGVTLDIDDQVQVQSAAGFSQTIHVPEITGEYDVDNDLVQGAGPPNTRLSIYIEQEAEGFVPTDENGDFIVRTSELQHQMGDGDLTPGEWMRVCYQDLNGNHVCQNFDWPQIIAQYEMDGRNQVWGYGAQPGATVYITVTDGMGGLVDTGATAASASGEYQRDFPDGTIVPGHVITVNFANGVIDDVHVVSITAHVDVAADIVTGTAPPSSTLHLNVDCENGGCWSTLDNVQVDASGFYTADFGNDAAPPHDIWWGDRFNIHHSNERNHQTQYSFWLPAPDVSIEKRQTQGVAAPGRTYLYQIDYWNDGSSEAENVLITDTLPTHTSYFTDTSGFPVIDGGTVITWMLDTVPPYSYGSFYVAVNVDSGAPLYANLDDNCVAISTSSPGDNPWNNNACTGGPWTDESDWGLWVNKHPSPNDPHPGQLFFYQIDYGTNGSAANGPAWLTDTLPMSTTVEWWEEEHGWGALWTEVITTGGQFVLHAPAGIPGDMGGRIRLALRLDPDVPLDTQLVNTVFITTAGDMDPDDNFYYDDSAFVSEARYDLQIDKWSNAGDLTPGGNIGYGVAYENRGNIAVHAWLTDTLPTGLTYQPGSAQTGGWGIGFYEMPPDVIDGNLVAWDLGEVEVGERIDFWFNANISPTMATGPITNCATIAITYTETTPDDNTACVVEEIYPDGPNLRVSKYHDWRDNYGRLEYRINVQNIGDETIDPTLITDTYPLSTTFSGSWGFDGWFPSQVNFTDNYTEGQVIWELEEFGPGWGFSVWFDVDLDAPQTPLRWYTNTVEVTTPGGDPSPEDNIYQDVAFSGGEVEQVGINVGETHVWVEVPQGPITITTATDQGTTGGGGHWDWDAADPIMPGDVITVAAGSGLLPVVIQIPEPFDAWADSITNEVWGQVDHLDHEDLEVWIHDGPSAVVQTDNNGNFNVTLPDIARNDQGTVEYRTTINYAEVKFDRRFYTQDLIITADYEHDWVNGNYEEGHTVWLTLTDSIGALKATAVVTTGPVPEWGGQSGFNTHGEDWTPEHPDLAPGDWVHGLVDGGYTTTVQIGALEGEVNVDSEVVSGTLHAPWWHPEGLVVNCEIHENNAPSISVPNVDPDGGSFMCDFSGMWNIEHNHNVAVNYVEPDGDRVQTHFYSEYLNVRANESHNWVNGDTTPGSIIAVTVWRNGLPVMAQTTDNGGGASWQVDFCCGEDYELRTGDIVEVQTSRGLTATLTLIPMTGEVDANADIIEGQLHDVAFPADIRGEVWTSNGANVAGQTDGAGNYLIDFTPFNVLPGNSVALWYLQSEHEEVGIVREALRLEIDTGRDEVYVHTAAQVPVTVTLNGGSTVTGTSDEQGQVNLPFDADIVISDVIEAWSGWGDQYANVEVVSVTAFLDDANDRIWGFAPANTTDNDNVNVGVQGNWQWTSSDPDTGYFEVNFGMDLQPDMDYEIQYQYPEGHQTRYSFGTPDAYIWKNNDQWNVTPGAEYSYQVQYGNNGGAPAYGVVITDTLPVSVTYLWDDSGMTPTYNPGSHTLTWNVGALGPMRNRQFELRVQLETGAPTNIQLTNEIEIHADEDRDPNNNYSASDIQPSDPWADPWVNKDHVAGLPFAGEVITYLVSYGNQGTAATGNVVITDVLPLNTTFLTTTFEPGVDGVSQEIGAEVITWTIGTLSSGEYQDFEMGVQIDGGEPAGALVVNNVRLTADELGDSRNDWYRETFMLLPEAADLWVNKWIEGDLSSQENDITYRILFFNDGPLDAENVVITDTLPVSLTHLWHSAGSVATLVGDTIAWHMGTVPAGASGELILGAHIEGALPEGATVTNTVMIAATTPEIDYNNNVAHARLGPPEVICVPWSGDRPHRVWSGLETTLKGTAQGYGLTWYEWDPGDGSPPYTGWVSHPHAIEARHVYNAPVDTEFVATLTVGGAFGWSHSDTYHVKVFAQSHGIEIDVAADEGLWYQHKLGQPTLESGYPALWWGGGNDVAVNASVVQAFQIFGHGLNGNPHEDPYVADVQQGWNWLFAQSHLDAMTIQPHGDPDSDGDDIGVGIFVDFGHAIYESGLTLLALASSDTPDAIVHTGPPIHVRGQTFYSLTQDMVDWFVWGQNDSGWARGGWRYQPNSGDSDNSNTQFPVLGLIAAEENWGLAVPSWVKDELRDYWLASTQNPEGGFGYTSPYDIPNVAKTGAGIMNLVWTGVPVTDTRVISASNFIEAHWHDTPDMAGQGGNVGDLYAMYAVKKGAQVADIHNFGPYFWDNAYTTHLVGAQQPDGRFVEDPGLGLYFSDWQPMATSWSLLVLAPGLYSAAPVPVIAPVHYGGIGAPWNGIVEFDASLSHHTDPDRTITFYEWNFGDGSPVVTGTNPITTHTYIARDIYVATLTVWDDVFRSASRATQVRITAPDTPPAADPNGPYTAEVHTPVVLDGSGSYDPDAWLGDEVVYYEWTIGAGVYSTTNPLLEHTWITPGDYEVSLRVRDLGEDFGLDSPKWSDPVTASVAIDAPISGLVAGNDSPTALGAPTLLTATVSGGTNVNYDWAFGDGDHGTGDAVLHTYPAVGSYTAVVTAYNSIDMMTATTTVTINLQADLSLVKTDDPDPVVVGDPLIYTLVMANHGPHTAHNVTLTDDLPAGVTFDFAIPGGPVCTETGGVVTCDLGNMTVAEVLTVTIGVTPNVTGTIVNFAFVEADEVDPNHANDGDTAATVVTAAPVLDPIVTEILPDSGYNDETTAVAILGSNFQNGATAALNGAALQSVVFVDENRLEAVVPAGMAVGIYDLTVTNPDTLSGVLLNAFSVLAPTPPVVTTVTPPQGPDDTPVTIDIYGMDFAPHPTVTLQITDTTVPVAGVLFVNGAHLRGIVPIYSPVGVYTLTVTNTDGRSGSLNHAYEVFEATVNDDLYAKPTDFWLDPPSLRQNDPPNPTIGLTVRRQSGMNDLFDVDVDFYDGDPLAGGTFIGRGTIPVLPARGYAAATTTWLPSPTAGVYTLYAIIDPDGEIGEADEGNNTLSRTATVLPPLPDITPPTVDAFSIDDGAATTYDRQVVLKTTAHDNTGGSGVVNALFVEYEFVQSIMDWIPVATSGWMPYTGAGTPHLWQLQPGAGVRYIKVWVADNAGNISLNTKSQLINYVPVSAYVAQGQVQIYRWSMSAGEDLRVRLTSLNGDADLYIWRPDGSLEAYSWADNPEDVTFTATQTGVYQIEVEGWTGAYYELEIIPLGLMGQQRVTVLNHAGLLRRGRGQPLTDPGGEPGDTGIPSAPAYTCTVAAAFDQSAMDAAIGAAIAFTDTSTTNDPPFTGWMWRFGDGDTATSQNTTHSYDALGVFTVTLQVTDTLGCTGLATSTVTIHEPNLIADFTYTPDPANIVAGETVAFTDMSTTDGVGITQYAWTFGDGGASNVQNPTHQYDTAGTYTVTLEVTDALGYTDTEVKANLVSVATGCVAITGVDYVYAPLAPVIGEAVMFTASATPANATAPLTFEWDFGDGTEQTTNDLVIYHTFTTPEDVTVEVTVANACTPAGKTATKDLTILPKRIFLPLLLRQ